MPGSLLNFGRSRLTRHDSTRSDISTYSNDSKKHVSFNKAVRVKKYTRSEDGSDTRHSGRKFWFRVYENDDLDANKWEEYSGGEDKGYIGDDRLKTIDESPSSHSTDVVDSTGNQEVQKIIDKFNQQSLTQEEQQHPGAKYDSLNKYKKNSILNGMKSFFGSASFRNKRNVQSRNLENLFRNQSEENVPNGGVRVDKARDVDTWTPKSPEKLPYSKHEFDNDISNVRGKSSVEVEKWESGDKLVFDARQFDKSVEKTDDGELTKTVEQGDKVWKNITRTITYAESSPRIIRKSKDRTNNKTTTDTTATDRAQLSRRMSAKRDSGTQCTKPPEDRIKNSEKYKVIRSRNGVVSAYSNVPLMEDDAVKTNKTYNFDVDRITRPTTCKRDHQHNNVKREAKSKDSKLLHHSDSIRKGNEEYVPSVMSRDVSRRKVEPKPSSRSSSDYRRGYATLSAHRRGSRNRARSHEDRIPNITGVKILVNGECVEDGSVRGGLAAAYKTRQRVRTSSTSPVREYKSYGASSPDPNSEYNHETVVLYIPGISHQGKRAEEEEVMSGRTITRSQSVLSKRPSKYKKHDGVRSGGMQNEEFDENDEIEPLIEKKGTTNKNQRWAEYRILANV